jgi:competence protein ComEC
MIAAGSDLSADLLKIGHHGSSSSSSADFLSRVNCRYAVISVGTGNDYGHPHKETMQKLQQKGITVYRTDQNKTVIAQSDGNNITFNTSPGSYGYGSSVK